MSPTAAPRRPGGVQGGLVARSAGGPATCARRRTWPCTCVPGSPPGHPRVSSDPTCVPPLPILLLCPQAPLAPTGLHLAAHLCPHDPPVPPGPYLPAHRAPPLAAHAGRGPSPTPRGVLLAAGFFDGVFPEVGTRISAPLRGHVTGRCRRRCEPRAPHGTRASGACAGLGGAQRADR